MEEFEQQKKTLLGGGATENNNIISSQQNQVRVMEPERENNNIDMTGVSVGQEVATACPKCGSLNVRKISVLNKSMKVISVFGAAKASYTWHCNQCKKEW